MADSDVADHYAQGDLVARIEAGFAASGRSIDELTVDDLAAVDEFHTGGRPATEIVLARLDLSSGDRVLDVGSGLGGAARFCASTYGCSVLGIDLTPAFVDAARTLTGWVGLDDRVDFVCAPADQVPPEAGPFDAAYLLHVGMNVSDKAGLFAAIAACLRPGGRLVVYDLMRVADGDLSFPVPWASSADTSFVESTAAYETALLAAGLEISDVTARPEIAAAFVDAFTRGTASGGPPPVGLHLVMGPTAPRKAANAIAAFRQGLITPVEILARA